MLYMYIDDYSKKILYHGEKEQQHMGDVVHKETYSHGETKIWVRKIDEVK